MYLYSISAYMRTVMLGILKIILLNVRVTHRERGDLPSDGSHPKRSQLPGLSQPEGRSPKHLLVLPCGYRGASTWAVLCCVSGHI